VEALPWVGRLDEKTLVYDSGIQLPECPHVFLWNPATGTIEKYVALIARKLIKPHDEAEARVKCVASYLAWKAAQADAWLQQERPYYESRRHREVAESEGRALALASLEQRHRLRLEAFGKAYAGVQPAASKRCRRVANCYACHGALDNSIQVECVQCGWILCHCGACGCGR
jgi:hypothetical protein